VLTSYKQFMDLARDNLPSDKCGAFLHFMKILRQNRLSLICQLLIFRIVCLVFLSKIFITENPAYSTIT